MRNKRIRSGFTLAELLIVVAIIGILSGVAFVAVVQHQKSLTQLEMDSIAKQIFVAAQNHLTMAKGEGYLGVTTFGDVGKKETTIDDNRPYYDYDYPEGAEKTTKGVNFFAVDKGSTFTTDMSSLIDQMIPFGSIDETVRTGGSYIIRYQKDSGLVLDVFYSAPDDKNGLSLSGDDYATLMDLRDVDGDHKADRRGYKGKIVGWYGGEEAAAAARGQRLEKPTIKIINAEKLLVEVTDPNTSVTDPGVTMQLIISGLSLNGDETGAKKAIALRVPSLELSDTKRTIKGEGGVVYTVTLDDITTQEMHFSELESDVSGKPFVPGQDISIQAVIYNTELLTNIAYSDIETTNSLYERIDVAEEDKNVKAFISNIRHLENLEEGISGITPVEGPIIDISVPKQKLKYAEQTSDLSWTNFIANVGKKSDSIAIFKTGVSTAATNTGSYLPVSPDYPLDYDGHGYSVTGIVVNTTSSNAGAETPPTAMGGLFGALAEGGSPASGSTESTGGGMFGTLTDSRVKNLRLVDFSINLASGNAGALAGNVTGKYADNACTVSGVLACNTRTNETTDSYKTPTIRTASGNAGGLIGTMSSGTVTQSASALIVESKGGNAGGLVGTATNGGTISQSYSGGHTMKGKGIYSSEDFNITATGSAGGLVGDAGATTITGCYSTCSAKGVNAGGLIGSANGTKATNCYSAGLVKGASDSANAGAFMGTGTLASDSINDYYMGSINPSLASGETSAAGATPCVSAFSFASTLYKEAGAIFPDGSEGYLRAKASAYDANLITTYKSYFYYLSIAQITGNAEPTVDTPDFLSCHYGDWQVPAMDTTLEIDNSEMLTAKISLPDGQAYDGMEIAMLVRGETTARGKADDQAKDAYLVFSVKKGDSDEWEVALQTDSSVVPGFSKVNESWGINARAKYDASTRTLSVNLDSITGVSVSGTNGVGHFAQLFPQMIPGENLIVVADGNFASKAHLQEIAGDTTTGKTKWAEYSSTQQGTETTKDRTLAARTNSLFANPETDTAEGTDTDRYTAGIANFRHLENLDSRVSGLKTPKTDGDFKITTAKQLDDLVWTKGTGTVKGFVENVQEKTGLANVSVYPIHGSATQAGCFLPVEPSTYDAEAETPLAPCALSYDGQNHSVTGVTTNIAADAGLFGALIAGSKAENVALVDFSVTSTAGNAGALAGTVTDVTVSNVVAYNSSGATTVNVSAPGAVGGLIGSMETATTSTAKVEKSAAALVVSSAGGNAGGLIGTTSCGTVSACYSGGHTTEGKYTGTTTGTVSGYNVTAIAGIAGGLIGDAGSTAIEYSYSTCSAAGKTAGGFVGVSTGTIKHCYATGLVRGTDMDVDTPKDGAFAYSVTEANVSDCKYFEIVNDRVDAAKGFDCLTALGKKTTPETARIAAFDATATNYNTFVDEPTTWGKAVTYDGKLTEAKTDDWLDIYYGSKYNLRTVQRLGATVQAEVKDSNGNVTTPADYVITHYGDWPAPEIFVENKGN